MGRFYLTTPIYYVNAKPHLGHAYTTIIGDAVCRWQRLLGDDVHFLTGTDEHGLKIQQAAEAAGTSPQTFADGIAPLFQEAWRSLDISNDDFIRTTEERHKAGVRQLLQACYDAGDIELGTYAGKYCVACEEYYSDEELIEGDLCPIHKRPVEFFEEENYFFKLSRFQDRLLDWYAAHPGAIVPEFRANEALGLIRGGLRDFSISRTSLTWGVPLPWDDQHVAYVWFDALANYLTAIGYGTDRARFERWWPVDRHMIGKDIIRHHCVYWPAMLMSAGLEPPRGWAVGGWLLVGGEKMSKTSGNVVNPLDLVDDIGVDGFRYYVLADTTYGQDGDFTEEGLIARYNGDLANNLGNLLARVATVVGKKCGGVGPAPRADSPLADAAATALDGATAGWRDVQPSKALEATWGLLRATNAYLEANEPWKAEPGPAVDAVLGDALEAIRIGVILASPALPSTAQTAWERIGLPGAITDQRLPAAGRWGGYPGGLTVTKGDALFPAPVSEQPAPSPSSGASTASPASPASAASTVGGGYVDSHCHLFDTRGVPPEEVVAAALAAGVTTMIDVGCDAATTMSAIEAARRYPGTVFATAGLHPHEARHGVDTIVPFLDDPTVVAVGECGLDHFYDHSPRDVQRAAFAAQIELAHERDLALVIHTRDAWDETFDVLAAEGVPERTVFHCFSGGPDEARRCLDLGAHLSFSGIVTFRSAADVQTAAKLCPINRLLAETDSPYLAPVPHRGRTNQPAHVTHVVRFLAELRGAGVDVVRDATAAAAGRVFRCLAVPPDGS